MSTVLTAVNQQEPMLNKVMSTYSSLQLSTTANDNAISETQDIQNTECIDIQSSVFDIIYLTLLYLLQFTYISYLALKSSYLYIHNLYLLSRSESIDVYQHIHLDKLQLTKIPKHLTFIISREILSSRTLKDWEEIMYNMCISTCWAWEFGIEEVSVYDASGIMQSMSVDLYKQQSTMLHEWMRTSDNKENTAIKFSILSDKDGHKEMGYVTQKIAKTLKSTDLLDVQLVDDYIHDHQSISDPDLCIVYDGLPHNYISLDGYPPWHIRLTEIINGSYYHTLNYALFSQYLYRYSKVEQRFGH